MATITYCWMCQINTFIQSTGETADAYELIDIESSASRPYQRFSLHVNYESVDGVIGDKSIPEFKKSADAAVQQGLCRALGSRFLGNCLGSEVSYVKNHLFSYAGWFWKLDDLRRLHAETKYFEGVRKSLLATQTPARQMSGRADRTRALQPPHQPETPQLNQKLRSPRLSTRAPRRRGQPGYESH